ncbi:MAG: HAMP domain-containing histidine kinase [Solirubrobacterales bacterium]|nr:HAMP domain-containing histidine kinase [Solirubrobacterales bacterium]
MSRVASLRRRLALLYAAGFLAVGLVLIGVVAALKPWKSIRTAVDPARYGAPAVEVSSNPFRRAVGFGVLGGGLLVVVVALPGAWVLAGRAVRPVRSAFDSQGRFIANAAHELRTPLTAERTVLQVALSDPNASVESLRAACEQVLDSGRDQQRLLEALLILASAERGLERVQPVDVSELSGAEGEQLVVDGDPILLGVLVANLLDNAREHNVAGGWVQVVTTRGELEVSNSGPVIPAEKVPSLFEPFERLGSERVGAHHGLGLSIVRAIARAHGGGVRAVARPDGGLSVTVSLPPAARASGSGLR